MIILYVNILAVLVLFISYFVPKLSGDFARLFREAPQLFAKVNKDWLPRAGAWIDDNFGAEATGERGRREARPRREQPAERAVILVKMPDGRYRMDLEAFSFEVTPAEAGKFICRATGAAGRRRRWRRQVGAGDQAVAGDSG